MSEETCYYCKYSKTYEGPPNPRIYRGTQALECVKNPTCFTLVQNYEGCRFFDKKADDAN